jgi:hypothetical protein
MSGAVFGCGLRAAGAWRLFPEAKLQIYRQQANPQEGGEAEGGVLPELTDLVGDGSFEKDGWTR